MSDSLQPVLTAMWSLACAAAGWFAHRRFSDQRDKHNRRIELLQYISKWRSQIERHAPLDAVRIFTSYETGVHDFKAKLHAVLADRKDDTTLEALGRKIGDLNIPDFQNTEHLADRRDVVCRSIDEMREHLKYAKD